MGQVAVNWTKILNNGPNILNCSVVTVIIVNSFSINLVVIKCLYRSSQLINLTFILKGNQGLSGVQA